MTANNLIVSTLATCVLFSGLALAQGAPANNKDKKKKDDQKPVATQSVTSGILQAEYSKKDDKKKEDKKSATMEGNRPLKMEDTKKDDNKENDKKSISASTGDHCFNLAADSQKKEDQKHKDNKPLLS